MSDPEAMEPSTRVDKPAETAADALVNRPASEWLDEVEGEIGDVDLVLRCLARDSATMCKTCHDLSSAGELEQRPVLARCASSKQTR